MVKRFVMLVALGLFVAATPAQAVVMTYFGEDLGLGEGTRLATHPNADTARASFLSGLIGVGTEDFESFADGTGAPLALNFGAAGTATLVGSGSIDTVPSGTNGVGRYPISGDNYWEATEDFGINFSMPIAAFGFYGVDIGDFDGQVTVTTVGGLNQVFNIGNSTNILGGSVLYWGFISTDPMELATSLSFGNTEAGTDYFGFDDMTIGSIEQVAPIPEPGTLVLVGFGLLGLAARRRRARGE
jgi:hypothetical protein